MTLEEIFKHVSEEQDRIMVSLSDGNWKSAQEIGESLSLSPRYVQQLIRPLRDLRLIRRDCRQDLIYVYQLTPWGIKYGK